MIMIDFLIQENYANTPEAASKILDASSGDFLEYLIQEMTQQQYERLKRRIANARTPEEKARLEAMLRAEIQKQRESILNSKKKKRKSKTNKFVSKSMYTVDRKLKPVKSFTTKTALGALTTALVGF